jgi:hypothetical protein
MSKFMIFIALTTLWAQASAQPQDFPADASAPTAAEIRTLLKDKVFSVAIADGTSWRLEYKDNGYFFIDVSNGFRSNGTWAAEDGKLCGQLKGRNYTCNDIRVHQNIPYYKRDSGEIVKFMAR